MNINLMWRSDSGSVYCSQALGNQAPVKRKIELATSKRNLSHMCQKGTYRKKRYSSTLSQPRRYLEVFDQRHAPAFLTRYGIQVSIEEPF